MNLEQQRYGRNKNTVINHTYIESGEYRRKFDKITDNKEIDRILYLKAKEMLNHRSGTLYEDLYLIKLASFIQDGYNDYEAQVMTLNYMALFFNIWFEEV